MGRIDKLFFEKRRRIQHIQQLETIRQAEALLQKYFIDTDYRECGKNRFRTRHNILCYINFFEGKIVFEIYDDDFYSDHMDTLVVYEHIFDSFANPEYIAFVKQMKEEYK